jgi:RNA-directed DNA polymerase
MISSVYDDEIRQRLARELAETFLGGLWNEASLTERAQRMLGATTAPAWLTPVARAVLAAHALPPHDRPVGLARLIEGALTDAGAADPRLERRRPERRHPDRPRPAADRMRVARSAHWMPRWRWPVPEIETLGDLAAWLGTTDGELAWFADARGLERSVEDERLRHYSYVTIPRRAGPPRVLERPKSRLKAIQRRLLREILDRIPVHDAAHGFTRGRSAITHAGEHTGQRVVVALDLEDFFASVQAARLFGIFRTAGYPAPVAHTLTALSTNIAPATLWHTLPRPADPAQVGAHYRLGRRLATPHLPQGAPTSPALANLAAFSLDRRLTGLAASVHARYSRYADDLVLSGSLLLLRRANEVRATIAQIVRVEGFAANERKSMLATRAGRQKVCGIVVNERPNLQRDEYDTLRAIVHNAAVRGPAGENRNQVEDYRAHLLGRIAWVGALNPARGAKLRREFARIEWETAGA